MKRGRVLAATLLTTIPFVGMTESATAATVLHHVTLSGNMRVFDSGGFAVGGLQFKYEDVPLNRKVTLKSAGPTVRTWKFDRCVSGETRGLLYIVVELNASGVLTARGALSLYEGADCDTSDREGTAVLTGTVIDSGRTLSRKMSVENGEWRSRDSAVATFSLNHQRQVCLLCDVV
ncbi:hypothetical protein GCM10010254_23720 [Streptomyces chromofuscus]|nr:hypothetical protein GCM10010254_23720 [Streptomyces chromofuscus]